MRKGLLNAELQSNAVGKGFAWTDLGGLGVGYKTTKEICLGIRTSGKAGSGSWDDPFDGSTRTLVDAKLAEIAAMESTNVILRVRDGVFKRSSAIAFPSNTIIIGQGSKETFFLQDALPALVSTRRYSGSVIGGGLLGASHGVHVEGVTIDCNYFNLVDQLADNESLIIQGLNFGSGTLRDVVVYRSGGRLVDINGDPVAG